MGTREVPFSRVLYIERDDFMENPPKKYHRLGPGREVRLRNAYIIKYESMVKDEQTGEVKELHCTYDPQTRNAPPADGRKVPGVIHWVSAGHCVGAEVRLYDRLFKIENPGSEGDDFVRYLNPNSLEILTNCYVEQSLKNVKPESKFQFERLGYFCADVKDSTNEKPVFNRIVGLRDSWAKIAGIES
jgi:glutaminyl-tRNA synthetase